MTELDIAVLGASKVDPETGAPKWQANVPLTDDTVDVEALGELDVFQSLGIYALPYGKTEEGYAEGVFARSCGGRSAVCLGARDTRTSGITGNLQPGDTVMCSTGPQQAAQVRCSEKKRQVVLATKDTRNKTVAFVLDGKNDKVQLAAFGHMLQFDRDTISITHKSGASLVLDAGMIALLAKIILGGKVPVAPVLSGAPPGSPTPGVFVGK